MRNKYGVEVPEVETMKMKDFKHRSDFNRYKKELEAFVKKDAFSSVKTANNVEISKSEFKEYTREIARINRKKEKEWKAIKDKKHTSGLTIEQMRDPIVGMGDERYQSFKKIDPNLNRFESLKDFQKRKNNIDRIYEGDFIARKEKTYRENYLKKFVDVFNDDIASLQGKRKLSKEALEVYKKVYKMSDREFAERYYTSDFAEIKHLYSFEERQNMLQQIRSDFDLE